jgi:hypothetical protein
MAYDTEEIVDAAVSALDEHGKDGVLKVRALSTHIPSYLDHSPKVKTLKRHLLIHCDQEGENARIHIQADSYYSLPSVDFEAWRLQHITPSRPSIPLDVRMRLWAASAGHCQFRGCSKPLTHDAITSAAGNFAQIAHIIAASENGPRGQSNSEDLADKYENLMLLCYDCHRLIDTREEEYSVQFLTSMKEVRENFISRIVQAREEIETVVLTLSAPIQDQEIYISKTMALEALTQYIPRDFVSLSLNDELSESDSAYWSAGKKALRRKLDQNIMRLKGPLSVFPLAPIPLCIYLGRLLGNKRIIQFYRNDRNVVERCWNWEPTVECREGEIDFQHDQEADSTNHIVIAFSISQEIDEDAFDRWRQNQNAHLYRMFTDEKASTWLRHRGQMDLFRAKYNELLTLLEHWHGKNYHLHILGPVPAPIAVEIGRQLPPKVAPTLHLYDRIDGEFQLAFVIAPNERLSDYT